MMHADAELHLTCALIAGGHPPAEAPHMAELLAEFLDRDCRFRRSPEGRRWLEEGLAAVRGAESPSRESARPG